MYVPDISRNEFLSFPKIDNFQGLILVGSELEVNQVNISRSILLLVLLLLLLLLLVVVL